MNKNLVAMAVMFAGSLSAMDNSSEQGGVITSYVPEFYLQGVIKKARKKNQQLKSRVVPMKTTNSADVNLPLRPALLKGKALFEKLNSSESDAKVAEITFMLELNQEIEKLEEMKFKSFMDDAE